MVLKELEKNTQKEELFGKIMMRFIIISMDLIQKDLMKMVITYMDLIEMVITYMDLIEMDLIKMD